jgi:hypothetical protein
MGTDVASIAALATQLANIRNEQAIGIAVLKKALDIEKNSAAIMLQALEATGPAVVTSSLGARIDTYA